ncbi:cell division suppressor protein YneA [Alkalithermobacter paradoxus]|uniref:Cell division suppressor protein YneA n=1 Tax=Alkalithermobacter paradoxus TaxID=29349 RepID=A0A1V4IB70_9FIRM|nr:cell division suppressor protein YneA [[Clostridium] thermoalcaliphilum]
MKRNYVCIILLMLLFIVNPFNLRKEDIELEFVEIQIQSGDTLWNIAREYINEKEDIRNYIYEIQKLNNLNEPYIYPGKVILIPIKKQNRL